MSESQSALFENEGINQPDHVGKEAVKRIQALRKKKKSHLQLIDGILNNDKIALSQSITLIESQNPAHQQQAHDIIQACLDRKSTRLNSSHVRISYAVFCLKKKKIKLTSTT